ncbi:ionotropic receptor 75a-like [Eurosta solidaginis]|uniref:ionotropic receptor 75a-like n=1 Tax=Eurosta solidaginis TaxID=178769 RepID=UPI003531065E
MDKTLLNFIINHFLSFNINAVVFFNCWSMETQRHLAHMVSEKLWHTRFVNINGINLDDDFEYRYLLHKRQILGTYVDMNCNKSEHVMNTLSRWRLYNEHYNWLLYDHTADLVNFKRLFMNANLSVNAQLTYAFSKPSTSTLGATIGFNSTTDNNSTQFYIKYDVFNNGRYLGGKLNMTIDREIKCNWGGCHINRYLSTLHLRSKYGHRNKLHDIRMRVSTAVTERPISSPVPVLFNFLLSENCTDVDTIARFGFHVLLIYKDFFGCEMIFTFHNHWGKTETSGGAIGDAVMERTELVSTPFLITTNRLKFFSPIVQTGSYRSVCLFRTPRSSSLKGDAFLQPFEGSVWLVFGVLLVILAVVFWIIFAFESGNIQSHLPYKPSLLATQLMAFGSACCQGSSIVPFSIGGRIAFVSLYLFTFLVYNYYTSILLSTLLEAPPKSNIKTLGQLADSSLEVGLEPLPYNYVFLNTSQLPDVRRFVQRKIESKAQPSKVWISATEGVMRVRDEPGFVYVLETSTTYPFLERVFLPPEICDLNEIMLRPDNAMYTQLHKNSTYKEFLRLKAIRMLETGVWNKQLRQWIKEKLNCVPSIDLVAVDMENIAPLFVMLLFTYILSLALLGLEILIKRTHDFQHRQMLG